MIANAVDLHLSGRCTQVEVTILGDGAVRVQDDGPGFPITDADGSPVLVRALTELHDAPTKDGHTRHVHLASFGLGLSVVHALSDRIEVLTSGAGRRWAVSGGAGTLAHAPRDLGPATEAGTTLTFHPDPSIFADATLDAGNLTERLRELAGLCPGLTLRLSDERILRFREDSGLDVLLGVPPPPDRGWSVPAGWRRPAQPLSARVEAPGMSAEVRPQWARYTVARVRGFVNLTEMRGGGTHVNGLRRHFTALARALDLEDPSTVGRILGEQVIAVVSVFHFKPTFAGPTRDRLSSPEVGPLVARAVKQCLTEFVQTRPDEAREIVASVLQWRGYQV